MVNLYVACFSLFLNAVFIWISLFKKSRMTNLNVYSFLFILSASLLFLSCLYLVDASRMTTLFGKSYSSSSSCVLLNFMVFCVVLSFPPGVSVRILILVISIPVILFYSVIFKTEPALSSSLGA